MKLALRYSTTLSTVTAMDSVIMISMVMTMVVITALTNATGVKIMIIPMVAMTMVMSMMVTTPVIMMVTTSGVFLYRWGAICIRLCICFLFALLWCLSALMCAVPTYAFAVGIFDSTFNMALSDD